jgi:hypothetical protein
VGPSRFTVALAAVIALAGAAGGQVRASANDLDFYPFDFLKCEFFARAIVEFGVAAALGCCYP